MLGIGGTQATGKNAPMESLVKKLAVCVSKFSHLAVNKSELKALQELMPEFCTIYELIGRNDTSSVRVVAFVWFRGCVFASIL